MTARTPAPDPVRTFSLGLGLTNECNLACSFCYRDPDRVDRLGARQVRAVLDRLPVRSVNLGTGENGMHPRFRRDARNAARRADQAHDHLERPFDRRCSTMRRCRPSPTSSSRSITRTKAEQDAQRGDGNWDLVMEQAARCRRLGVGVTFIAVMMRTNFDRLHEIAAVAPKFDAPLRINVYQAVRTDAFALTYEEYWTGFERLFAETDVVAIGEPLVRAMAGLPARRGGCGVSTVRVTPRATVQPCVYWGAGQSLDSAARAGDEIVDSAPFEAARSLPEACEAAPIETSCHGGCAGRRRLLGRLDAAGPLLPDRARRARPLRSGWRRAGTCRSSRAPARRSSRPVSELRAGPTRSRRSSPGATTSFSATSSASCTTKRQASPAADGALTAFRACGGTVVLVSNAPEPGTRLVGSLTARGVAPAYDGVATAADVARVLLKDRSRRTVLHIGPLRDRCLSRGWPSHSLRRRPPSSWCAPGIPKRTTTWTWSLAAAFSARPPDASAPTRTPARRSATNICGSPASSPGRYRDIGGVVVETGKPGGLIYRRCHRSRRKRCWIAPSTRAAY